MNWQQIEGKWDQVKGDVKTKWAKLTEDDLKFVGGSRDRLVGKINERYGVIKEQAMKDVDEWVTKVNDKLDHVGGDHKKS
jgi:uncharacterized protein YjbJ (UPF0337 family)